ncbi:hypothetical protein AAXE64_07810 [Priestia megaterium]|nr:hypothetical protein [Priestia megaterium]
MTIQEIAAIALMLTAGGFAAICTNKNEIGFGLLSVILAFISLLMIIIT